MSLRGALVLIVLFMTGLRALARDTASTESSARLIEKSRDAYALFERAKLAKALAAKGVEVSSRLGRALDASHWHVRHCALLAIKELARKAGNRAALEALVPKLGRLVTGDPHHGVRVKAAECLEAMAEHAKGAQRSLAKAAVEDGEDWVKAAASKALTQVKADIHVMMPVFEAMIRSTDRMARGEGIKKAEMLHQQKTDIAPLIPALKDVFRKPIYDANHSHATRNRAINVLHSLKVDTSVLVPFIVKDLRNVFKKLDDGYHPYQKITLDILGRMGARAEKAIPVLEEVIADPTRFGCARRHPDYKRFISISQESIKRIRADVARRGKRR